MVVVAMDTAMMVVMVTVTRENSGEPEDPFHVVVELFATAADSDWISASTFHDYGDSQDLVQHSFGETAARSNVDCQHCAPGNLRFLVLETKFPPLVKKQHRYFPNLIVWTEKCMKVIILSQNFKAFVQACALCNVHDRMIQN